MTDELTRRAVAAALMSGAAAGRAFAEAGADRSCAFQVLRNGHPIGTHTVRVKTSGDRQVAAIAAEMLVKIGPVPVFKYRHDAVETWDGGRFVSLTSRSVSNGKAETVDARATGDGVRIVHDAGAPILAAGGACPLTHWNRDAFKRALFNPQTGALLRCSVARRGVETLRGADGRPVQATAFAITGETDITDWYDQESVWAALQSKGPDGSSITYRRV